MFFGCKASSLFTRNYYTDSHIIVNQGGSSSGKTHAIIQVLFCLACQNPKQVITIVGQDIPNLKAGVLRDALNIYADCQPLAEQIKSFNKSERIFEFFNKTIIEFKSYSDAQDAKSGKRDYLFVNEANGVDWNIYSELALRTKKRISTASIVASVMTTYFQLKVDIQDIRLKQEAQSRVDELRMKVLENQVAVLQQQVDEIKTKKSAPTPSQTYSTITNPLNH